MKKNIIPEGSIVKMFLSVVFFMLSIIDIFFWKTIVVCCIGILLSLFFMLFGIKIIKIRDNIIFVSSDLLIGWYKVQYKTSINLDEIKYIEEKVRDYTYSSRGHEKTGRGIETRIAGNKFIEFTCTNDNVQRIHCNDLSRKQINYILDYCKNKNIKIIK